MTRPFNERRYRQVVTLVERRRLAPKRAGFLLGLTVWNVYKILRRKNSVQFLFWRKF